MRIFTINAMSFILIYLPLTLLAGLLVGAFEVDGADDGAGYEIFLWFVVALQMIVPTLLAYILSYHAVRVVCRRFTAATKRYFSIVTIGLSLPLLQAFLWQGISFSSTWVLVAMIPAAILGGVVQFTTSSRTF